MTDEKGYTYRLLIINLVWVSFAMARTATNQWLIVYFFDHYNIFQCTVLFGCRTGIRFISNIIWGYLGDYFSNKKLFFFMTGHVVSAIIHILFLFHYSISHFAFSLFLISVESVFGATNTLLDAVAVNFAAKNSYGKSRFWFSFGFGLGSIVCGIWAYFSGSNAVYIYFYSVMIAITCSILGVSLYFIPTLSKTEHVPDDKSDAENTVLINQNETESIANTHDEVDTVLIINENNENIIKYELMKEYFEILSQPMVILFNMDLFALGISHSFIGHSLFIYLLDEFSATQLLCGLITISMISGELLTFHYSTYLLNNIGIIGLLLISHLTYTLRVTMYTLIPHNPSYSYLFLIIEPLHGLMFAAMWLSCIEYANRIAPIHLKATIIGTVNGIYHGFATMIGAILCGYLYKTFGSQFMFRSSAIWIFVWLFLIQISMRWLRVVKSNRDQCDKYTASIF
eukprot:316803_1